MGVNVTANSVDPGIARTRLNRDREGFVLDVIFFLASKFVKTIHQVIEQSQTVDFTFNLLGLLWHAMQAAATTCYVAAHPAVEGASGKYYADCNEAAEAQSAASGE
ncbi:short-chain dehydrogenase TIC 32, chloroplastic-like, partial [Phalaenopsis equestris]|uniref:short-chain dehydrogenase TIC 32, chloroplastic-like n=1 Tax=Phalaenopsis equestris TaxID=78828 RepID=UPI0009E4BB07